MIAIKITDTTEYCLRLEPGTFAMPSENHTTTPTARMWAKVLNRVMQLRTVNKQRQAGKVRVIYCSIP